MMAMDTISASDVIQELRHEYVRHLSGFVSDRWILRQIFKFTDEEVSRLNPMDSFIHRVFEGASGANDEMD
jgi:hypothetical protein